MEGSYVRVNYDFTNVENDELPLQIGDVLLVTAETNIDWCEGRLLSTGIIGHFPINFVSRLELPTNADDLHLAVSINAFPMGQLGDLAFDKGSLILIQESVDENWFRGVILNQNGRPIGESGIFPKSFVAQLGINTTKRDNLSEICPKIYADDDFSLFRTVSHRESGYAMAPESNFLLETLSDPRDRAIHQLVTSENQFVLDIKSCRDAFLTHSSTGIDPNKLLIGYDDMISLATRLRDELAVQADLPDCDRTIGSLFLRFSPDFSTVYSQYGVVSDTVSVLLHNYLQKSVFAEELSEYLRLMQRNGNSCIDIHSAVCRPLQRVLKYPLFLNQLFKCTRIDHVDHPKLVEAITQMANLVKSLNEQKRQKDLVVKYRKDSDKSISYRLSQLNMHTMRKKSARLGFRLSSSVGITHLKRDEQFADLELGLNSVERLVRRMVADSRQFLVKMHNFMMNKRIVIQTWTVLLSRPSPSCHGVQLQSVFITRVVKSVIEPLEKLLYLFEGPHKLIAKRRDKLIDFLSIKSITESEQTRMLHDEYAALNAQLKAELPSLITLGKELVLSCQLAWVGTFRQFYEQYWSIERRSETTFAPCRQSINDKFKKVFINSIDNFKPLLIYHPLNPQTSLPLNFHPQDSGINVDESPLIDFFDSIDFEPPKNWEKFLD